MRYFKFTCDNGCHTGAEDIYVEFDDNVTEAILNEYGAEALCAYAEAYDYLVLGWYNDETNEDERNAYHENCNFSYEEVTKEEYMENCEE